MAGVFRPVAVAGLGREFWENVWTIGHLVAVAGCILLLHLSDERNSASPEKRERLDFWLGIIMQFFFGGLLSTFLVFYFRSASFSVSWPFFALLGAAFVANERLRKRSERLAFQVSLFFLCLFSFAIFIVPVVVHSIGPWAFVFSGAVSLVFIWFFIFVLRELSERRFNRSKRSVYLSVAAVYFSMNILYFTSIIPPIPLSLADGGAYHSIVHVASGDYDVTTEEQGWTRFFTFFDDFHATQGETIYAYSSVFSPASLNTTIVHVWEHYDPIENRWVESGRVSLALFGGREGGYRTYSQQSGLAAGKWRVSVETPSGQVIGRIKFNLVYSGVAPILVSEVK